MKLLAIGLALAMPIAASAAKLITDGTTELFSTNVNSGVVCLLEADKSPATSNLIVTVESTAQFEDFADSSDLNLGVDIASDYIGAIVAMTNANGDAVWMASDGSGWVELSGHTPETNTEYTVKTELDLGAKKLRHLVKSGEGEFSALCDWLPAATNSPVLSSIVAFGDFESITLNGKRQTFSEVAITGAGNLSFNPTHLRKVGITGNFATALNATGANGLTNWVNYVLGINTTQANAKPYTAPVQNADPAKLTFSLGGVDVNASSGATVKYAVGAVDSPSVDDFTPSSWVNPDEAIQLEVPSGVKYYRMKVKIETP